MNTSAPNTVNLLSNALNGRVKYVTGKLKKKSFADAESICNAVYPQYSSNTVHTLSN